MYKFIKSFFFLILLACYSCASYKNSPSKFYKKHPFAVTFIFDDFVKDSSLCSSLNMSFIKDTKMGNVNIVRLNIENSKLTINPATQCSIKLGNDFTTNTKINDACKEVKNYLNSKDGKYSLYVYTNQMKQNCAIDGAKSYTEINNLNQAIISEISSADKKNILPLYIYVPSFVPSPPPSPCDSIRNIEVLFGKYNTLYSTDDYDPNLHYLYPAPDYYYIICDSICGADKFHISIFESSKPKENILPNDDYPIIEGTDIRKAYPGKFVLRITNDSKIKGMEHTELNMTIEPVYTNKNIPRSKTPVKINKITFTGCQKGINNK